MKQYAGLEQQAASSLYTMQHDLFYKLHPHHLILDRWGAAGGRAGGRPGARVPGALVWRLYLLEAECAAAGAWAARNRSPPHVLGCRDCRIVQFGHGLPKIAPGIAVGCHIDRFLKVGAAMHTGGWASRLAAAVGRAAPCMHAWMEQPN